MEHNYPMIDTASLYNNEESIGKALKECFDSGKKREDVYIVTKLQMKDFNDPEAALRESLKKLQLEYVDLYLIHWMLPQFDWETKKCKTPPFHQMWATLESCVEKGLTKSIGVSNCNTQVMLDVLAYAKIKPAVNQIEAHPYFQQKDLIDFFRDKFQIHTMAYAPLSSGQFKGKGKEMQSLNILQEKVVTDLAQKYEKSVGQIVLNWHLHRGHIIIPKTTNPKRLPENLNCYGFKLTDEEY